MLLPFLLIAFVPMFCPHSPTLYVPAGTVAEPAAERNVCEPLTLYVLVEPITVTGPGPL